MTQSTASRTAGLTALAMVAFAANSIFGRLGLVGGDIGAGSFALIRIWSGAVVLLILVRPRLTEVGSWKSGAALFTYAAFFSYAYITLPAGTGALILFALVQMTMLGWGLITKERLSILQWMGVFIAIGALVWLLMPGLSAPDPLGAFAMAIAGFAWGIYSLLGRGLGDPVGNTAGNFIRASVIATVLLIPMVTLVMPEQLPGARGIFWAIVSGALTSGIGYVIWYAALKNLTATRAGIAQLSVPAIAALGGILFLAEPMTTRFFWSSALILGGVALATLTTAKTSG